MRKVPANTFHVAFDTLSMPGLVVATEIKIGKFVGRDNDTFRLDLCDHPLYTDLHEYCRMNPPPKRYGNV